MNNFYICEDKKAADKYRSCWGNSYLIITREDIEALLDGKILASDVNDEYGLFISMEDEQ